MLHRGERARGGSDATRRGADAADDAANVDDWGDEFAAEKVATGEGEPSSKRLRSTSSWWLAGAVQSAAATLELPGQSTGEYARRLGGRRWRPRHA